MLLQGQVVKPRAPKESVPLIFAVRTVADFIFIDEVAVSFLDHKIVLKIIRILLQTGNKNLFLHLIQNCIVNTFYVVVQRIIEQKLKT